MAPQNWTFFQESIEMANKHMKWCSTTLVTRDTQIKANMRHHGTPRECRRLFKPGTTREDGEPLVLSGAAGKDENGVSAAETVSFL